jgi:hypothetical protein
MKLELCNNTSESINTIAISTAIASVILGIAFMVYDYNTKSNASIAAATTCEQAVVLAGTDVEHRLIGCKLQLQATQVGKPQ